MPSAWTTIQLPRSSYRYDPSQSLGPRGGFGQVFLGETFAGEAVAVKKLDILPEDGGHRELAIVDELAGKSFDHVIPFFDGGEDAGGGGYFVVMARGERSLEQVIDDEGQKGATETANILLQIVGGLLEVGELVHRDLKPANILFHEGRWKIADFGIARFVEEATSSKTLKNFLSEAYAAPEQWRGERASHATDVYALGCIAFCLLTRTPPCTTDYAQQHQFGNIPKLSCDEPRLRSLIMMMLRKPADARPEFGRIQSVLTSISGITPVSDSEALRKLADAGAAVAERTSQQLAEFEKLKQLKESRDRMLAPAIEELRMIQNRLWEKISSNTPAAVRSSNPEDFEIALGDARLAIVSDMRNAAMPDGEFRHSKWDVIAGAQIWVTQAQKLSWGASLWYARLPGVGSFRWYEISYVRMDSRADQMPTQCVYPRDADLAVSSIMNTSYGVAFGPVPIDDEDEERFHERWIELLALASSGRLGYPVQYPVTWPLRFA
jgi:serine/threonine protein kinase